MKKIFALLVLAALACMAQASGPSQTTSTSDDISGMYSFQQEGEFVQINVEDGSRITGFISRYGDSNADKGAFLDHTFKDGELKGKHIHFTTRSVHGVAFEFDGTVERGDAKDTSAEGYRVLRGKLTEYTEDANKKMSAKSREVSLKSFPQDAMLDHPAKD
jgi:hypothetical protein